MPEHDLFQIFTKRLNEAGITYMVTGAAASIVYGEPRLTHDLDIVAVISFQDAEKITASFPDSMFYCPPVDIIRIETKRLLRGHFNIIHHETGFKADIFIAGQDMLHQWALQHRKRLEIGGETLWLAPLEYVIIRKLEYYREGGSEKHLRDIQGMLLHSSDQIDYKHLQRIIREHSLKKEAKKAGIDFQQ